MPSWSAARTELVGLQEVLETARVSGLRSYPGTVELRDQVGECLTPARISARMLTGYAGNTLRQGQRLFRGWLRHDPPNIFGVLFISTLGLHDG